MDWTPLFQALIGLLATLLTFYGSKALMAIGAKNDTVTSANKTTAYSEALLKSLMLAGMNVLPMIEAKGYKSAIVQTTIINEAQRLIERNFPEALGDVGLSPDATVPENAAKLVDGLTRALPEALLKLSASPATPDSPTTAVLPMITASVDKST